MRLRSSAWWAWQLEKLQRSLRSRPEDRREEADGARGGEKIKEILRGRHMADFFSTQVRKTPDQVSPASGSRFRDAAYQKAVLHAAGQNHSVYRRSEEHTSELQSRENLVCRLLLEKKKYTQTLLKQ